MDNRSNSIEELIDFRFSSLSQSQKKVAVEIRRDLVGVAFLSAQRLGQLASVSEATVHRLAYALGFASFSEMQEHLKSSFLENRTFVRLKSSIHSKRGLAFRPDQALETDIDNLQKTLEFEQGERVWEAARHLQTAARIYVAGWKACVGVSSFLGYSLNFMLGNAMLLAGEGDLAERVAYMTREDVLIAVAFPRYSAIILKVVKMAKQAGVTVIVMTDSPVSPFCQHADVILYAAISSDGFLDSYTSPLSLSNSLIQTVGRLCNERVLGNLEKMESGLKEFREIYQWKED